MRVKPIVLLVPVVLLAMGLFWDIELVLRLSYLSIVVLLTGFLWTWVNIRGLEISAEKSIDRCQVGDRFEEKVTVANHDKMPKLLVTVEEKSDLPGYHNITALSWLRDKPSIWQNNVACTRRGQYSLGSFTATASDPFGLFHQQRLLGQAQSVLVYPATVELPFFTLSSAGDADYISGHRSINQISPEASTVREFADGDSLNHIHWRSTAHTGKLMVKTFDVDHSRSGSEDVWVVLDMQQMVHSGEGAESTEEYGVTVAASLVKKYLEENMKVGLIAAADQPYFFLPDHGEIHSQGMLEALAVMKATGQVTIDSLVADNLDRFRSEAAIIIITPAATDSLAANCWRLKNSGKSVIAILLDSASFGNGLISQTEPSVRDPAAVARGLFSMGIPAYMMRRGDRLANVLDSRVVLSHGRFV